MRILKSSILLKFTIWDQDFKLAHCQEINAACNITQKPFVSELKPIYFLTFPAYFSIPIIFSNLNHNSSNLLDLRNLQEQVKKAFCYHKLFWPFTVLKKSFSQSLEQFFLTVGQNNFGNKIPFLIFQVTHPKQQTME